MQKISIMTIGIAVVLAGLLHAAPARAQETQQAAEVPGPEVVLLLVRSTLTGLDHANRTGNYAVLHGLGVPDFRNSHTPASLAVAFTKVRQQLDMSVAAAIDPELTEEPFIGEEGLLWIRGFLPTNPVAIGFELVFEQMGAAWGLSGIGIFPGEEGPPQAEGAATAGAAENEAEPSE